VEPYTQVTATTITGLSMPAVTYDLPFPVTTFSPGSPIIGVSHVVYTGQTTLGIVAQQPGGLPVTVDCTWLFGPDPAFFNGEASLGSGVYYLGFPDTNLFGYYSYVTPSIFYHYEMGYEGFVAGSASDIYLYDFTSGHWWYTSNTLFPYVYDFSLSSWLYYFPATNNPGHYTSNPRYFSNLTTGKIITM
jgi:hypothetical protein